MIVSPVYASEIMSITTYVVVILALAFFFAWALVAGLGNPEPQVEGQSWPFGLEIIESIYVPEDSIIVGNLRALRMEQYLAASVMRPTDFVVIRDVT